jgi:hypothetical protein
MRISGPSSTPSGPAPSSTPSTPGSPAGTPSPGDVDRFQNAINRNSYGPAPNDPTSPVDHLDWFSRSISINGGVPPGNQGDVWNGIRTVVKLGSGISKEAQWLKQGRVRFAGLKMKQPILYYFDLPFKYIQNFFSGGKPAEAGELPDGDSNWVSNDYPTDPTDPNYDPDAAVAGDILSKDPIDRLGLPDPADLPDDPSGPDPDGSSDSDDDNESETGGDEET